MVMMTPYQAQTGAAPKLEAPKPAAAQPAAKVEVEEVAEPKKRESKKAEVVAPATKANLDAVLKAWGDEE
jgi:hypothetical protein